MSTAGDPPLCPLHAHPQVPERGPLCPRLPAPCTSSLPASLVTLPSAPAATCAIHCTKGEGNSCACAARDPWPTRLLSRGAGRASAKRAKLRRELVGFLTLCPTIPLPGTYPKDMETGTQTDPGPSVFTSAASFCSQWQKVETTYCPSTDEWATRRGPSGGRHVVQPRKEVLDACFRVDEFRKCGANRNQPDTQGQIPGVGPFRGTESGPETSRGRRGAAPGIPARWVGGGGAEFLSRWRGTLGVNGGVRAASRV